MGAAFRRLWWAAGISSSGDGLVLVAMPLLAVSLTRSPVLIAGVTAANRAAAALSSLPGGLLADRVDRRRLMVACNLVAGAVVAGLVAVMSSGTASLAMLYVVGAVLAACDVTYELAAQAYVPAVVGREQLPKANARLQVVANSGEQFVGPGVGGALFALAQRVPFVVDAVSFFLSAVLVRASRPRPAAAVAGGGSGGARGSLAAPGADAPAALAPTDGAPAHGTCTSATSALGPGPADGAPSAPPASTDGAVAPPGRAPGPGQPGAGTGRSTWSGDFLEGWRWFRRERPVQLVAGVVASLVICQYMVFGILVVYATRMLHLTSTGYGLFYGFASLLGVLAGFGADRVTRHLGAGRAILVGFSLVVVSYLGLGFTRTAVLAVFVFGLQDVGTIIGNVGAITTRQRLIPTHLYGRVVSIHRLAVAGAAPLGALLGGVIAGAAGTSTAIVMAGGLELVFLSLLGPALVRSLSPGSADVPSGGQ